MIRDGSDRNWNANLGYVEEVQIQLNRTNEALSASEAFKSFEALRTFYDLATIKQLEDVDHTEFNDLVNSVTGILINREKTKNALEHLSLSIELSKKMHTMHQWILRLMRETKLIKLDADSLDPVEEVRNDY